MASVSKIVYESVSSSMMRKSINEAYSALFEGLTPPQKTRRNLRQFLPEPPGGWDSPAVDGNGKQMLTVENSRPMSFAECLEYNVRNTFFHDGGRSNPKFEPGVARIAYAELGLWPEGLMDWTGKSHVPDWPKVKALSSILRNITSSHADDYDFDLNGMTFGELSARFAHGSSDTGSVNDEADGTGCRYNVTWIPDFRTAQQYAKYTAGTQTWCLTESRRQWNHYMKGNTVKMYICTRPGFEDVPGVPGDNCPLDEYGLSMIGVSVNPDGSLDTCCTRWNHLHGGSDLAMDEAELCKVLNVRKLSDVCPPYSEEEIAERGKTGIERLMGIIRNPDSWGHNVYAFKKTQGFEFGDLSMWEVYLNGVGWYMLLDPDGNPVLKYPLCSYKIFGGVTLLGHFDPYADYDAPPSELCDEYDEEVLIFSRISGKTYYFNEPGAGDGADGDYYTAAGTAGDLDIEDIIGTGFYPETYDFRQDDLIQGIALSVNVAFEGNYLFDAARMKFVSETNDRRVDISTGNMFSKDNSVFLVTRDRVVNYGDMLAKSIDPGYPRKMPNTGRPYRWHAELFTASKIDKVGILLEQGTTGWFFIASPLDGTVIRKIDGVISVHRNEELFGDGCFVLSYEDGQRGVVRLDGKTIVAT